MTRFNPHQPRRADATWPPAFAIQTVNDLVSILISPEGLMLLGVITYNRRETLKGFNPHQPRRADAT